MLVACLLLLGVNQGYGFFNTPMMPPYLFRNQANNGYEDAQNSVGYSYDKPANAWSDVSNHQLILEPVPKSQYLQEMRQHQVPHQQPQQQQVYSNQQQNQQQDYRNQQLNQQQDYSNQQQSQQIVNNPPQDAVYDEQPYSYLQPPQKNPLQFNDERYDWSLQPAIKYNMPTIPHPFYHRDPQQQHMSVLVPLRLFGVQSFPPVLERLIQMVQNHYSVYNNPDTLIIPPTSGVVKPYVYEKPLKPFDPTNSMMGGEQGTGDKDQTVGVGPAVGDKDQMMGEDKDQMMEGDKDQIMGVDKDQMMGGDKDKPYVYGKPSEPFDPTNSMMAGEKETGDKEQMMGGAGEKETGDKDQMMGGAGDENKETESTTVVEEGLIDERFGGSSTASASSDKSSEATTVMMGDKMETTEEIPATTMKPEEEKMADGEETATTTAMDGDKEKTTVSEETSAASTEESEKMESTTAETDESSTENAKLEPMS